MFAHQALEREVAWCRSRMVATPGQRRSAPYKSETAVNDPCRLPSVGLKGARPLTTPRSAGNWDLSTGPRIWSIFVCEGWGAGPILRNARDEGGRAMFDQDDEWGWPSGRSPCSQCGNSWCFGCHREVSSTEGGGGLGAVIVMALVGSLWHLAEGCGTKPVTSARPATTVTRPKATRQRSVHEVDRAIPAGAVARQKQAQKAAAASARPTSAAASSTALGSAAVTAAGGAQGATTARTCHVEAEPSAKH